MKKILIVLVLISLLSGCAHKTNPTYPPKYSKKDLQCPGLKLTQKRKKMVKKYKRTHRNKKLMTHKISKHRQL